MSARSLCIYPHHRPSAPAAFASLRLWRPLPWRALPLFTLPPPFTFLSHLLEALTRPCCCLQHSQQWCLMSLFFQLPSLPPAAFSSCQRPDSSLQQLAALTTVVPHERVLSTSPLPHHLGLSFLHEALACPCAHWQHSPRWYRMNLYSLTPTSRMLAIPR